MFRKQLNKNNNNEVEKWYKGIVIYRFDYTIFSLFLQIVVDFLRNTHLNSEKIDFNDIFDIDYENNIIREGGMSIKLDDVNLDDKKVKKKLSLKARVKLKAIKNKIDMKTINSVYNRLFNNFGVYAKYGMMRVEYSMLKNKVALIFYTKHKGIVKRMKENRALMNRGKYKLYHENISIFIAPTTFEDIENELDSNEVLKEVEDIIHT